MTQQNRTSAGSASRAATHPRMLEEHCDGTVAWLTFDRPEQLNAFTVAGYRDLRFALERLGIDDSVRAVVMTGRGRAFSAGADRSLLDGALPGSELEDARAEFTRLLETLGSFQKPLFAAVNGIAVGFGCTILLYCDVVILAETARLRLPFTALGIVPEAGSSTLLPARARLADAMWAMLSSEWIDAAAAVRSGLALRSVSDIDLIDEVTQAAAVIAAHDPRSVAATKRLMTSGRASEARQAIRRELDEMLAIRTTQ
jgi:enoyl-CoA hydratase/carnithine racemase